MTTRRGPTFLGLAKAVTSLVTPMSYSLYAPAHVGERYHPGSRPGIEPLADIYLPLGGSPRPAVLLVHGGAFIVGSRKMKPSRFLATRLSQGGFAVASIDYRMVGRGGRIPESVDDVLAALHWWGDQARRFHLNRRKISIVGLSAGATLGLLAAARAPGLVHRAVSCFGAYDFGALEGPLASLARRLVIPPGDGAERWSPIRQAEALSLPVLLQHGTDDGLVPVEQSRVMHAAGVGQGHPWELKVYDGLPHGFYNNPADEKVEEAVHDLLTFLRG